MYNIIILCKVVKLISYKSQKLKKKLKLQYYLATAPILYFC